MAIIAIMFFKTKCFSETKVKRMQNIASVRKPIDPYGRCDIFCAETLKF